MTPAYDVLKEIGGGSLVESAEVERKAVTISDLQEVLKDMKQHTAETDELLARVIRGYGSIPGSE